MGDGIELPLLHIGLRYSEWVWTTNNTNVKISGNISNWFDLVIVCLQVFCFLCFQKWTTDDDRNYQFNKIRYDTYFFKKFTKIINFTLPISQSVMFLLTLEYTLKPAVCFSRSTWKIHEKYFLAKWSTIFPGKNCQLS